MPITLAIEQRYDSGASFAPDLGLYQSAFDCQKIERAFGWKPQHSWRNQG